MGDATSAATGPDVSPSDPPPVEDDRNRRFWLLLAGIGTVALAARIGYVLHTRGDFMFVDSYGFHLRARIFAEGKPYRLPLQEFFGRGGNPPDAHVPPLWPTVLGGSTMLGFRSVLAHQVVTAFVGAAAVVMTGLAGRAALGRRVGLVAAGIFAVYPNAWVYERELLSESLSMFMVGLLLTMTYRFMRRPGSATALAMGLAAGFLALTRAEQVLAFVLVLAPATLVVPSAGLRRRLGWAAIAAISAVAPIVPWAAFNATRFEEPVPISYGMGLAMRSGNCAHTYENDELLGWFKVTLTAGQEGGCTTLTTEPAEDPSVEDLQLREAALTFMWENRGRLPTVVAARIGRTFNVFRPFDQIHKEAERGSSVTVLRAALLAYWVLVPFAVAGTVLARRRGVPVFPLLAFFVIVVAAVGLTIGSVRYRAPAEVPLVILASVALVHLAGTLRPPGGGIEDDPVPGTATGPAPEPEPSP